MSEAWAFEGSPPGLGASAGAVTLLAGASFCISGRSGDLLPDAPHGLFVLDTRFLSRLSLRVDGRPPEPLTLSVQAPFEAVFLSRMPPAAGQSDSTLLVTRRRSVADGLREQLSVRNVGGQDCPVTIELSVDADFADLFEVKERRLPSRAGVRADARGGLLRLRQRRDGTDLTVMVHADGQPQVTGRTLRWDVVVPARGWWEVSVHVVPVLAGRQVGSVPGAPTERPAPSPAELLQMWERMSSDVYTADRDLAMLLANSAEDLGALRITDPEHRERVVMAAGAPWFMAIFGRDSLLTSWMLLPLEPSLALGTLHTLAARQGRTVDPRSEEEPGRILHEMRFGSAASLALGGGTTYYGTADATPLFVLLLGELRRWGVARAEVERLLPFADAALEWLTRYGDRDGDGFVEYARSSPAGLVNQGWKDSWNGVTFADGSIAEPPIALAEVQAYTYAAYVARAHFAREMGEEDTARHWTERAEALKRAFNEAFWLPEKGWLALGLDAHKRPIDALASNMGHCLWTGILAEEHAAQVADRLLSAEMFSGWGIRTLATSMGAYNPMSYHNGSVWPHDNALCAAGLMRYGFVEHAQRVAIGIIEAGAHFGHRLPELFCGFDRADYPEPVPYPTSCAPQAWAAATPFQLVRTMLRLDPWVPFGQVWCAPAVPERFLPMRVNGLRLGDAEVSLTVTDGTCRLHGAPAGLSLVDQPRRPLTALSRPAPD